MFPHITMTFSAVQEEKEKERKTDLLFSFHSMHTKLFFLLQIDKRKLKFWHQPVFKRMIIIHLFSTEHILHVLSLNYRGFSRLFFHQYFLEIVGL